MASRHRSKNRECENWGRLPCLSRSLWKPASKYKASVLQREDLIVPADLCPRTCRKLKKLEGQSVLSDVKSKENQHPPPPNNA